MLKVIIAFEKCYLRDLTGLCINVAYDYFGEVTDSTRIFLTQKPIQEMVYLRPYPIRNFESLPNIHLRKRKSMENVSILQYIITRYFKPDKKEEKDSDSDSG